ncbi:hypothetical protein LG299_12575 [Microbacterium lacus]|uniref:hypothetical protein n=1 Tax=Microbacterium lacus TaxID=415217 RepID=UPI0038506D94
MTAPDESTPAAERVGHELRPAMNELLGAIQTAQDPILAARTVRSLMSRHVAIALSHSVHEGRVSKSAALEVFPKGSRKAFRQLVRARRHAADCGHSITLDVAVPDGVWVVRLGDADVAPREGDFTAVILTTGQVIELAGVRYRDPASGDGWLPGWSEWSLNRGETLIVEGRHWDTDKRWIWEAGVITSAHTAREIQYAPMRPDGTRSLLLVVEDVEGQRQALTLDEANGELHFLESGARVRVQTKYVLTQIGEEFHVRLYDRTRSLGVLVRALLLDPEPLKVDGLD